jgi:hypothetical protein
MPDSLAMPLTDQPPPTKPKVIIDPLEEENIIKEKLRKEIALRHKNKDKAK